MSPRYGIVPDEGVKFVMSSEKVISQLENQRRILNERLMNAPTLREANQIERELWAIRAAIRFGKRFPESGTVRPSNPEVRP
jgi:hypothetical protein